jgi:predicted small lipoprotein YifL
MTAQFRLLALTLALGLLVASCGQKGPLRLPEDESGGSTAVPAPLAAP